MTERENPLHLVWVMFFAVMQLKLGHLLLNATSLFMSILVIKIFYIHLGSYRDGMESKLGVLKQVNVFKGSKQR